MTTRTYTSPRVFEALYSHHFLGSRETNTEEQYQQVCGTHFAARERKALPSPAGQWSHKCQRGITLPPALANTPKMGVTRGLSCLARSPTPRDGLFPLVIVGCTRTARSQLAAASQPAPQPAAEGSARKRGIVASSCFPSQSRDSFFYDLLWHPPAPHQHNRTARHGPNVHFCDATVSVFQTAFAQGSYPGRAQVESCHTRVPVSLLNADLTLAKAAPLSPMTLLMRAVCCVRRTKPTRGALSALSADSPRKKEACDCDS